MCVLCFYARETATWQLIDAALLAAGAVGLARRRWRLRLRRAVRRRDGARGVTVAVRRVKVGRWRPGGTVAAAARATLYGAKRGLAAAVVARTQQSGPSAF